MPKAKSAADKEKKKKANPMLDEEEESTTASAEVAPASDLVEKPEKTEESTVETTVNDEDKDDDKPRKGPVGTAGDANGPLVEKVELPSAKKFGRQGANIDAALGADQRRFKELLAKQEKYPIHIPLSPGEKAGPNCFHDVFIQGLHIPVPKGVMVRVPLGVYTVLMDSLNLNAEAGSNALINRSSAVEDALS